MHQPLHELLLEDLERSAIQTIRINDHWLRMRTLPVRTIPKTYSDGTLVCEIFSSRWMLIVSVEGKVSCQDLLLKTNTTLQLRGHSWNSCACRLYEGNRIRLAMTAIRQIQRWHYFVRSLYQLLIPNRTPVTAMVVVTLDSSDGPTIEHIGGFVTQYPANVQVLGAGCSEDLVAFTRGCFIDIVDWKTKAHATIPTHTDELDELVR